MHRKIGLSLASLGLIILLVEAFLRFAVPAPRFHREPLEIDSELGFRGVRSHRYVWTNPEDDRQEHEIVLDRDGFRAPSTFGDGAFSASGISSPAAERIVFLGDSFLVGESVPADALLTSRVRARWPSGSRSVEVHNLSTIDYGTGQQLLLLDRFGGAIRPKRVVLMMYPSNDVANNAIELAGRTRVSPGDAIRPYLVQDAEGDWRREWWMPGRARARRLSRLFAWAERGFFAYDLKESARLAPARRLELGAPPREFLEVYREHADPGNRWAVAWRRTEALIRRMKARSEALDAELVIGVIPAAHQVLRTPQRIRFEIESRIAGRTLDVIIDWDYPEERLERFLGEEQIGRVFLLNPFRDQANAGRRLFSRDLHFNREGHELAADLILELLKPRENSKRGSSRSGKRDSKSLASASWAGPASESWLDLRKEAYAGNFGDGWLRWQARDENRPGGWWLAASEALVVLRPAGNTLTLRGIASGPTRLELGTLGSPLRPFDVRGPGPFEARVPFGGDGDGDVVVAPGGEAAIVVKKGSKSTQLLLQEIGFSKTARSR